MGAGFEFEMRRWYHAQNVLGCSAICLAPTLLLSASLVVGSVVVLAWAIAVLAFGVWSSYWLLTRFAVRIQVVEGRFSWQAPLTHGAVPMDHLRRVRPSRVGSNIEVFEIDGCPSVLILARRGIEDVLRELVVWRPDLETRVGAAIRFRSRLPLWLQGSSGFRYLP